MFLIEVEYLQTIPSDWFDPDSWIHRGNLQGAVRDNDGRKRSTIQSSLLNLGKVDPSSRAYDPTATLFTAIPHAEQVPCQYDFAWFRGNSTFSLKISSDVTIAGFYLGDQVINWITMASLSNPYYMYMYTIQSSQKSTENGYNYGWQRTRWNIFLCAIRSFLHIRFYFLHYL